MFLERALSPILDHALTQFPAVLITGPRQSGKTTLVRTRQGREMGYVNFDDPVTHAFAVEDPRGFLDTLGEKAAILDEVQYAPELFSYLKMDIDRNRRLGKWLLTGSQHFALMKNVGESLAGRVAILELPPFSTAELFQNKKRDLKKCIWNGFYPEPALAPEKRDLWVQSYLRTYIERDVRQLQNIKDLRTFTNFLALCAASHGQLVNMASLSRDIGISQPAVKQWLSVLEASYITVLLPPYYSNLGKRIVKSPKLYFFDPALASFLTRQPSPEAAMAGSMGGAFLEGLVVTETIKQFMALGRRPEVYFWRSHDGLEVDLLIGVHGKLLPVEIKLTATPTPRHLDPLNRFKTLAGDLSTREGLLVCTVSDETPLAHGNIALPWSSFPSYLKEYLASPPA